MLHDTLGVWAPTPRGGWTHVYCSRAGEGTKVSIHALHALLGLIT